MVDTDGDRRIPVLRFRFPARPQSVRVALRSVQAALAGHGVPAAARDAAELVLAEVLNNVVEHAYFGRGDGVVDLELDLARDPPPGFARVPAADGGAELLCRVGDRGSPFRAQGMPGPDLPDLTGGAMPEGGFGWALIHRLSRNIVYRRDAGRNLLSFSVPLDVTEPAGAGARADPLSPTPC